MLLAGLTMAAGASGTMVVPAMVLTRTEWEQVGEHRYRLLLEAEGLEGAQLTFFAVRVERRPPGPVEVPGFNLPGPPLPGFFRHPSFDGVLPVELEFLANDPDGAPDHQLVDNGPLDEDPRPGTFVYTFDTENWEAGEYVFQVSASGSCPEGQPVRRSRRFVSHLAGSVEPAAAVTNAPAAVDRLIFKTDGIYAAFPRLHILPDGRMAITHATRLFPSHTDPTGGSAHWASPDEGVTWNPLDVRLIDRDWINADGHVVLPEYRDGTARVRTSTDGGHSWTYQPIPLPDNAPRAFGGYSTAASFMVTENGIRIRALFGRRPDPDNPDGSRPSEVYFARSEDDGKTWTLHPMVPEGLPAHHPGLNETALVQTPSGRILALSRSQSDTSQDDHLWQSESYDDGLTWSVPVRTSIRGYPAHAIVLDDGKLLCAYGYRSEPMGIRAVISRDEGQTWDVDNELILRADGLGHPGDNGMPLLHQLSDGSIIAIYYLTTMQGITHIASTTFRMPEIGDEDSHAAQTWQIDAEDLTNWRSAVFIGNTGGNNALIITNGGSLHLGASNAHLLIGDKEGSNSNRVVVTGNDSRLTVTTGRDILLGRGIAEKDSGGDYNVLSVENGAYLATRRLHTGERGSHNKLYVQDNARLDLTGWLRIGHFRGARDNEAHVSGHGTKLTTPRVEIGEQAWSDYSGSLLTISNGAEVKVAQHVRIVSGTDSRIEVSGGARVSSASAYIAGRGGSDNNRIVISGEGTTWTNSGSFVVNNNSAAAGSRLEIRDGALLDAASLEGSVEVRAGGTLLLDGGTLITPDLLALAGGTLEGAGTVEGGGDIAGTISPGLSARALAFTGDLVLREGFAAHFGLGGTGGGESGQIACANLELDGGGTLYLSALPGYTPRPWGDRIVLFDFNSLTSGGSVFLVDDSALPEDWSVEAGNLMLDGSITVLSAAGIRDSDGDGIPDWWEEQYFGGPTNADASAASDATQMTNLEKFIAGLEPFNDDATFVFEEQVLDEAGRLVLRWASVEGRVYSIEASNALNAEKAFTPLTGAENLSATPPQNTYTVDPADGSSFYRIRVRLNQP